MNIRYVNSKNKYQSMNTNKNFYPADLTREEIKEEFMRRRLAFGKDFGFDGHKMFMADQVDSKNYLKGTGTKIGTSFELTPDYVEANPNGWTDINEDILIITDKVPGVVAGHPVADCPVIMITDTKNKVTAVGHCSCELIDAKLPMMLADSLVSYCNSKDEDLFTFVSACAGPEWRYNNMPSWAKDQKLWEEAIKKDSAYDEEIFKIDLRKAIQKELAERNIKANQIYYDLTDTISSPECYSNYAASPYGLNDSSKSGRQFIGAFYKEKPKVYHK